MGLTEPEAGSDVHGIKTVALQTKQGFVLNGAKMFITNANVGHTFVVAAKFDNEISLFIVEKGTKGLSNTKPEDKLGLRASDTGELIFEDCLIPTENLLGNKGEGFKYMMRTLDEGRISIGALALGLAQGAFDKALVYARERKQFGQPIVKFQAIQNMIADMATEIAAARFLIYDAAEKAAQGLPFIKESSMAKLYASEVAMRVTKNAIQILGGYGYTTEYEVERFYRDAKLCEIGEGTSEIQRIIISRHVVGK